MTQRGPVDKERRVQLRPEKEDRRFGGPLSTRLSSVNVKPAPPLLTHMCASSLAQRHNIHQTDYSKGKSAAPRRLPEFYQVKTLCAFWKIFFFFNCSSTREKVVETQKSAAVSISLDWTLRRGKKHLSKAAVSFFWTYFCLDCVLQQTAARLWRAGCGESLAVYLRQGWRFFFPFPCALLQPSNIPPGKQEAPALIPMRAWLS